MVWLGRLGANSEVARPVWLRASTLPRSAARPPAPQTTGAHGRPERKAELEELLATRSPAPLGAPHGIGLSHKSRQTASLHSRSSDRYTSLIRAFCCILRQNSVSSQSLRCANASAPTMNHSPHRPPQRYGRSPSTRFVPCTTRMFMHGVHIGRFFTPDILVTCPNLAPFSTSTPEGARPRAQISLYNAATHHTRWLV